MMVKCMLVYCLLFIVYCLLLVQTVSMIKRLVTWLHTNYSPQQPTWWPLASPSQPWSSLQQLQTPGLGNLMYGGCRHVASTLFMSNVQTTHTCRRTLFLWVVCTMWQAQEFCIYGVWQKFTKSFNPADDTTHHAYIMF